MPCKLSSKPKTPTNPMEAEIVSMEVIHFTEAEMPMQILGK